MAEGEAARQHAVPLFAQAGHQDHRQRQAKNRANSVTASVQAGVRPVRDQINIVSSSARRARSGKGEQPERQRDIHDGDRASDGVIRLQNCFG